MTDIVDRLMNYDTCHDGDVDEAAKEITRLRAENEKLRELAVRWLKDHWDLVKLLGRE